MRKTYVRIAEIYRKQGKFDLALDSLKKGRVHGAGLGRSSLQHWPSIYQAQGRYDESDSHYARTLLKKSEKTDGKYSNGERSNRAVFLERLGTIYRDQGKQSGPPTRSSARSLPWGGR